MTAFDKGFDRIAAAMAGVPDRVPFVAQMHEFAMSWTRQTTERFYSDPDLLVQGIVDTALDFEFDIPCLGYDVYNIEAEALGATIRYFENGAPVVDKTRPLIVDKVADLAKMKVPDFKTAARMPFVMEIQRRFQQTVGYPPPIQFTAPFSLAVILRGYEHLITDIYTDPGYVHDLMTFLTDEFLTPWILQLQQVSPESGTIRGADALASFPLINVSIFTEFVLPYVLRLKKNCGQSVAVLNWWGESHIPDPEVLLEQKRVVSQDVIQGQDPDVLKLGPSLYKQFAAEKNLALIIGIGDTFLRGAGPERIKDRIIECFEVCKPGGRFMLYFCDLTTTTPPDNIRHAIEIIKQYGTY